MPDDILISELSNAPQIDDSAVFPFSQDNGGTLATFKSSMSDIAGKVAEGTTYTNLQTTSKNLVGAINEVAQGGGGSVDIISTASGTIATFNDGGDNIPVKSLVTDIVATQSGTGTPSPSNPRAISGFDNIDVNVFGINLFNPNTITTNSLIRTSDGMVVSSQSATHGSSDYIPIKPNTSYYFMLGTISPSTTSYGLAFYDKNKTFISSIASNGALDNNVITTPLNAYYLRTSVITTNNNAINYPSTVTTYNDFNGTTHTITLPETIYGGYLDVVNGELVITHAYYDLANYTGTVTRITSGGVADRTYFRFDDLSPYPLVLSSGGSIISDKYEQVSITASTTDVGVSIGSPSALGHSTVFFRPENPNSYTEATIMTYIQTTLGGLQIVYKLAEADYIRVALTPEQITTLSGLNNIYSNCGDVEIEYFNSNADQTAELIDAKQEYVNYSSEEKVVGKWLDGSVLYEKTLFFNNKALQKNDNDSELKHGISNIGSVKFVAEAYCDFNGGQDWKPCPNMIWDNSNNFFQMVVGSTAIYLLSANGVYFSANVNRSYLIKIRYTKT